MIKKETNFFEEHIEKIVLIIVGSLAAFLLVFFVILSPVKISYDKRQFSAGSIDEYIMNEKAKDIRASFEGSSPQEKSYNSRVSWFINKMSSPVEFDSELALIMPDTVEALGVQPKYNIPEISNVAIGQPVAERIRAAAYVPAGEVSPESPYSENTSKVGDIDLVSVEAQLDVASLYEIFKENFAGPSVRAEWRNEELAKPIFAAVNLQRKVLQEDGTWSEWQDVPRISVESNKEMFEVIEDINDLPRGGINVRMLRYKENNTQMALIQPKSYQIASAREEWLPPSLHKEYIDSLEILESRQRREARENEGQQYDARGRLIQQIPETTVGGKFQLATYEPLTSSELDGVFERYERALITEEADFSQIQGPLLIWAHDDTVKPNETYRYRIRVGVFNPVAGTDKITASDADLENQAILWTNTVEVEDDINIPSRIYFFAKDIQEAEKKVTVTIYSYALGYWYGNDFSVKPGELIGDTVVLQPSERQTTDRARLLLNSMNRNVIPDEIDYSTGSVVVDAVKVNSWTGTSNIFMRSYFDMLYSQDGTDIDRTPIGLNNWSSKMRELFNKFKEDENKPRYAFKDWTTTGTRTRRRSIERTEEEDALEEELMRRRIEMRMNR